MASTRGVPDFADSEPEFLLGVLDRHPDWAVLVCLIGGGQEINTGEAGLPERFRALGARFPHWDVYVSGRLTEYEYDQGTPLYDLVEGSRLMIRSDLHLATNLRSFRSENVSAFVKAVLDLDDSRARTLCSELHAKYPIWLTRDLSEAKRWVRSAARGTERIGLTASSGAHRLRPLGITVKSRTDPAIWFLYEATDVRPSYYFEEVATEFDVQGLELDWTIVSWDADLRHTGSEWEHMAFRGTQWERVLDPVRRMYLRNAYRVLLTRARQGMVIVVPAGDALDATRLPSFYDGTYGYLKGLGIRLLSER